MTPDELRAALSDLELTVRDAATALDIGERTFYNWLSGSHPVPRVVALLLEVWRDEFGRVPHDVRSRFLKRP
jgi:hypothetical protein